MSAEGSAGRQVSHPFEVDDAGGESEGKGPGSTTVLAGKSVLVSTVG